MIPSSIRHLSQDDSLSLDSRDGAETAMDQADLDKAFKISLN